MKCKDGEESCVKAIIYYGNSSESEKNYGRVRNTVKV